MVGIGSYFARGLRKIVQAAAHPRAGRHGADSQGVSALSGARVRDLGSLYSVSVSGAMVREWIQRWPASGLHGLKGVTFEFDKRNGDLVDVRYRNGNAEKWDGPALVALSEDAQAVGRKRLGLAG